MRTVLLLIFFGLIALLLVPVILVSALLRRPGPIFTAGRWAVRAGCRLIGLRLKVEGLEKLSGIGSCIFMPNHVSLLDGPLMYISMNRSARAFVKQEVFKVPILGQGMRVAGFIPVDRKGRRGGRRAIEKAARQIREKGDPFLVFPEGTRSRDGRLQEFRRGGFFLALESGAPIVPVSISGTYAMLPRDRSLVRPGKVRVRFHDPVEVDGFDKASLPRLMNDVREAVLSGLELPPRAQDTAAPGGEKEGRVSGGLS